MNAIILSGGKNTRMAGKEKAFLQIGPKCLIQLKIDLLQPLFDRIIVVTNNPARYCAFDVDITTDKEPGLGPLMGLYSGLKSSPAKYNFVTTCDTPFLQKPLVEHLKDAAGDHDAAVPKWNDNTEPLCAVYSTDCIEHIANALKTDRRVVSFFDQVNVNYIPHETVQKFDPKGLSFFNINTTQDYEQALKMQ